MDQYEESALASVVDTLVTAFPTVPETEVRECVERVLATYDGARVRTYVPILVARDARAELAAAARPSGSTSREVPEARPALSSLRRTVARAISGGG